VRTPTASAQARRFGDGRPELVGNERVQERVETAVDVEQKCHDRRQVHMAGVLLVGFRLRVGPLLPQHPDVVRQRADGKRHDERDQQPDDFPTTAKWIVLREYRDAGRTVGGVVSLGTVRRTLRHDAERRLAVVGRRRRMNVDGYDLDGVLVLAIQRRGR